MSNHPATKVQVEAGDNFEKFYKVLSVCIFSKLTAHIMKTLPCYLALFILAEYVIVFTAIPPY